MPTEVCISDFVEKENIVPQKHSCKIPMLCVSFAVRNPTLHPNPQTL